MKTPLFLILVYFGAFNGALAQNYSPVQGWSQDLRISEADLITEVEAETAFEYFYGDDGITCKGQIDNLVIDRVERNNAEEPVAFEVTYKAFQYTAPFCIPDDMMCMGRFQWLDEVDESPYTRHGWVFVDKPLCEYLE